MSDCDGSQDWNELADNEAVRQRAHGEFGPEFDGPLGDQVGEDPCPLRSLDSILLSAYRNYPRLLGMGPQ